MSTDKRSIDRLLAPYRNAPKDPEPEKGPFWTEGRFMAFFILLAIVAGIVGEYFDPTDHHGQECAHAMREIDCDRHGEHCRAREGCDLWISPSTSTPGKRKEPVPR